MTGSRRTVAVLVTAWAGAACSEGGSAPEPVPDQVHAAVAAELGLAPADISTRCPADAVPEAGAAFECTIDVEGRTLTASVAFADASQVSFRLDGRVIRRDELEAQVRTLLASPERLGEPVVDLTCGERELLVIKGAETVRCHGIAMSGASGFAVVGLDADGNAEVRALTNR